MPKKQSGARFGREFGRLQALKNDKKLQTVCQDLKLISTDEQPPFLTYNAGGSAAHLIVCDHAANLVPKRLENLGVSDEELSQHIGWDPGALDIAKLLADALDAPLIYSCYSRLVCDLNRYQFDQNSMPESSDGIMVPGNRNLSAMARYRRFEEFFRPYHDAIAAKLDAFEAIKVTPSLLSIHTCTDKMNGKFRPWPVSLSYAQDIRISKRLIEDLRRRKICKIGDNEPYSLDIGIDFTVCEHAMRRGLAYMQVEFRQDLVVTKAGVKKWVNKFLPSLQYALKEPGLSEPRYFECLDFVK